MPLRSRDIRRGNRIPAGGRPRFTEDAEPPLPAEQSKIDFHHNTPRTHVIMPFQIRLAQAQRFPEPFLGSRPDDQIVDIGRMEKPLARGADKRYPARSVAHHRTFKALYALQTDQVIERSGSGMIRFIGNDLTPRKGAPLLDLAPQLDSARKAIPDR